MQGNVYHVMWMFNVIIEHLMMTYLFCLKILHIQKMQSKKSVKIDWMKSLLDKVYLFSFIE